MNDTKEESSSTTAANNNNGECKQEPCSSTANEITSATTDSSTSGQNKPDKKLLSEALQSMQHGKRHMIVSDYKSAVPCFEIACEFLGQIYGLRALECAEAYLYYGISLYEMSRLEEGFDGGIVNVENKEDSGEEEEDDDDDEDGDANENDENKNNDDDNKTKEDETKTIEIGETKPIDIDLMAQPSTSIGEPSSSNAAANGEKSDEEDDNASNIEIAYEVLTTAKEIYSQHMDNKDIRLNYAETLQKLGEISIDWENPDGAIELLNECLEHRKTILEPDDRLIAVTYHYLGLAFSFKYDCDNSNICFQKALDVIQLRIDNLKAKDTSNMDLFEKASHESEIQQLESLIPEIQLKIEDMKEQIQSRSKTMITLENENKQEEEKTRELLKEKPINNVTHLIKRKRDDNENDLENNMNNKKICSSSSLNSSASTALNATISNTVGVSSPSSSSPSSSTSPTLNINPTLTTSTETKIMNNVDAPLSSSPPSKTSSNENEHKNDNNDKDN